MRKVLMASAVAFRGLAAVPATAMPIAPLTDAPSGVALVAWGCGPGWTRRPYGHCHPMGYGAPRGRLRLLRPPLRPLRLLRPPLLVARRHARLRLRLFAPDERSRRAIAGGFNRSSG